MKAKTDSPSTIQSDFICLFLAPSHTLPPKRCRFYRPIVVVINVLQWCILRMEKLQISSKPTALNPAAVKKKEKEEKTPFYPPTAKAEHSKAHLRTENIAAVLELVQNSESEKKWFKFDLQLKNQKIVFFIGAKSESNFLKFNQWRNTDSGWVWQLKTFSLDVSHMLSQKTAWTQCISLNAAALLSVFVLFVLGHNSNLFWNMCTISSLWELN